MVNPFKEVFNGSATYTEFLEKQIKPLEVNDSVEVDIGNKSINVFRATIGYLSFVLGTKYKTRSGDNNSIWVKRIK